MLSRLRNAMKERWKEGNKKGECKKRTSRWIEKRKIKNQREREKRKIKKKAKQMEKCKERKV